MLHVHQLVVKQHSDVCIDFQHLSINTQRLKASIDKLRLLYTHGRASFQKQDYQNR